MRPTFCEQRRPATPVMARMSVLAAMLAAAGCLGEHSRPLPVTGGDDDPGDSDEAIAALMADGDLPASMRTPPRRPPPPPRFCGFFPPPPFPGGSPGGDAGVPTPAPVPVPPPPVMTPGPITGGSSGGGSGMAGAGGYYL
jgi:hypothetical protein